MKRLIFIHGTMGVGKTATSLALAEKLPASVFLDGDWAWDMHPFQVTEETKAMVTDNITHALNNFLSCSAFQNVIFCWVMHEESILQDIVSRLDLSGASLAVFTLVCSEEALRERLGRDVARGARKPDVIPRSVARLPLYDKMRYRKLDVSNISAEEAAGEIESILHNLP